MNIKLELKELFNQACFIMSLPFMLAVKVFLGIAWLCQQEVFTLGPEWYSPWTLNGKRYTK